MLRIFRDRPGHYALLILVAVLLFFLNLGGPSLWDIDEGNNAEAAREMFMSGNWIVPTFNFRLRTDKPALLYWFQIASYRLFGIHEFSARFPSALAALVTVLVTYEFGRRLFQASTGILAGLILASTALFCAASHFANPDALLVALTTLAFFFFWTSFASESHGWFVPAGICTGLAVLAKGPVGIVMPLAVIGLFLWRTGRLGRFWRHGLIGGILAFILVAIPWYVWVSAETKFIFLREFFFTHNTGRFSAPMEGHGGPIYYYLVCLPLGFVPWSAFFIPVCWAAMGRNAQKDVEKLMAEHSFPTSQFHVGELENPSPKSVFPYHFLWCWILIYLVFFSLSGTKLPNYILPIYPPLALLTARFLDRWRRHILSLPGWLIHYCLICLALVGIGSGLGLAFVGGAVEVPFLRGRYLWGLDQWAVVGAIPVLGALTASWFAHHRQPLHLILSVSVSAVLFIGSLAAWGSGAVDAHKAAKPLVRAILAHQNQQEIRIGCYQYYQPSLVFYCRREVIRLNKEDEMREFLQYPIPIYLLVPAKEWKNWENKVAGTFPILDRHYDLYQGEDIVVVTNR
jgi:4-amino-4-deoxy-L-arabinose transferase-like glycosyltransferase